MKSNHARFLCALLALLTLASCGGETATNDETTQSDKTTTESVDTEETDGLPDVKMDGFEFSINHYSTVKLTWATTVLESEAENGDLFNDEIFRRNRRIEERFDCTINVTDTDWITANTIASEVMAGDSNYDVWFSYDLQTLGAVQYLMTWDNLPYVNLDREWWNPLATEVFNIGGKQYAAAGNFSLSVLSRASGYIFNKEIYGNLNSGIDMYKLAEDGKWTVDKMATLAKMAYSDLNGNAQMDENDRYGIVGTWKEICCRVLMGSGVRFISKDADGFPVFDLPKDENSITKIIKLYDSFMQDEIYRGKKTTKVSSEGGTGDFKKSGALFIEGNPMGLEQFRELDLDIGFVPCPKFDEDQERYYAPSFGAEISVLLKTLPEERWENVGLILEALAFDSQRNLIPTYKEVVLKTKSARDDESASMIDIIIDSISFDFGINAWQDTVVVPFIQKTFADGNPNFASALATMQSSVDAEIEKLHKTLTEN